VKVSSNLHPHYLKDVIPLAFLCKSREESYKSDVDIYAGDFTLKSSSGFYQESSIRLGFLKSKFLLDNLEGTTKLWFLSPRYRILHRLRPQLLRMIFEVLEVKLLQRGYTFMHSACIERKNEAILVCAPPDTGKTLTTIRLVTEYGFRYMSDDMTILGKDAFVYSYPISMTFHIVHLKELNLRISAKLVRSLKLRTILNRIPKMNRLIAPHVKINPQEIIDNQKFSPKAKASKIFFLEFGNDEIKKIPKEEAHRRIIPIARMHRDILNKVFTIYAYYHGLDLWKLIEHQNRLFRELIDRVECYLVRSKTRRFAKLIIENNRLFNLTDC